MRPALPADFALRSEADQAAFFNDVFERATRAEAAVGTRVHDLRIVDQIVRLVYAGPVLDDLLTPALSHLEEAGQGTPDLILHVFDSESTGIDMCSPPVEVHCFSERGDIWTFESERWRSAFMIGDYSLNLLDMDSGVGICWVRDASKLPYWTVASPFRALLAWWLTAHGAQLVHGAAVGTDDGAVLIVGKGGVGKSTTALTCLAAGFRYAGDDYVVVGGRDVPSVYSLYQTAKLDPETAQRFCWLDPHQSGGTQPLEGEKSVVHVARHRPTQIAKVMPLRAVLTPSFVDRPETVTRLVKAESILGPALYTTLAQLPHAGPKTLTLIERTLCSLPCFSLELGNDFEQVPQAITAVLADVAVDQVNPIEPNLIRPLVSVIIPVADGLAFLPEAIASVLDQDYPAIEIIVVDDGVDPTIRDCVAALPVQVRLLPKRSNGGAADARNTGIRAASGEIIAFLDVDDLWAPGKLAAQVEWLATNPHVDVVTGSAQTFRNSGSNDEHRFVGSPAEGYKYYVGAALFRKRAFDDVGLFDAGLRLGEDTDWFARAGAKIAIAHLETVVLLVRRHETNTTAMKSVPDRIPIRLARNALLRKRQLEMTGPH
jgi:GT2 family glycosyltransferase